MINRRLCPLIFTAILLIYPVLTHAQPYWCPDLHTNDFVDFGDFAVLAGNWNKSGTGLAGDFDGNGTVDIYDLERISHYWLDSYECKSSDFNFDYTVNFTDLTRLANAWLADVNSANWDAAYDLDYSEQIDFDDLNILCRRWLKEYPKPNDTFDAFKDALVAGDVDTAVSFFADSVIDEYTVVLGELQAVLPDMANGMGELQLIYADGDISQYEMLHDEGGGVISSFPVYFCKDADGNWKIYCF
jgi:hypothetical protein